MDTRHVSTIFRLSKISLQPHGDRPLPLLVQVALDASALRVGHGDAAADVEAAQEKERLRRRIEELGPVIADLRKRQRS